MSGRKLVGPAETDIVQDLLSCSHKKFQKLWVRQTSYITYKLHVHTLDNVEASKFLGVTINNNLSWDRHIDNIVGKGNKTLGFFRRNLKDCTKPIKSAAYTQQQDQQWNMQAQFGIQLTKKRSNPQNRYRKEQQDLCTTTQTEHQAVSQIW